MIDIKCYRANYDKAGWEKITEGWTKWNVMPGAILAVNALCDEVERQQAKIDALMLEYCQDEMTKEQFANWESHQRIVKENDRSDIADALDDAADGTNEHWICSSCATSLHNMAKDLRKK